MYYENYRRRLRREELRKKAREAKLSEAKAEAEVDNASVSSGSTADSTGCSGSSNILMTSRRTIALPVVEQQRRKRLIVLVSNGVSDRNQATKQSRAMNILEGRQTPFDIVDGMDPNQRTRRNELFQVSGIRGNYPQFFFAYEDGDKLVEFVGGYDRIENLNEADHLPMQTLRANPNLETWGKVFGGVVA